VDNARSAVATYTGLKAPQRRHKADLAAHSLRLAKLDSVYRAWQLDPRFEHADPLDVEDLLALLAVVPFDGLLHKRTVFLNPVFDDSALLGGADADLIAGDLLADVKTTKRGELQAGTLDQLLGYFFLARRHRQAHPNFSEVKRLGVYFSRHGPPLGSGRDHLDRPPAVHGDRKVVFREGDRTEGGSAGGGRRPAASHKPGR
jgi:hypothetical protein